VDHMGLPVDLLVFPAAVEDRSTTGTAVDRRHLAEGAGLVGAHRRGVTAGVERAVTLVSRLLLGPNN
jgi:hypothetical protein